MVSVAELNDIVLTQEMIKHWRMEASRDFGEDAAGYAVTKRTLHALVHMEETIRRLKNRLRPRLSAHAEDAIREHAEFLDESGDLHLSAPISMLLAWHKESREQ